MLDISELYVKATGDRNISRAPGWFKERYLDFCLKSGREFSSKQGRPLILSVEEMKKFAVWIRSNIQPVVTKR